MNFDSDKLPVLDMFIVNHTLIVHFIVMSGRPVLRLRNPCEFGTPIMHEATGGLVTCYPGVMGCPAGATCTVDPGTRDAVCCPNPNLGQYFTCLNNAGCG